MHTRKCQSPASNSLSAGHTMEHSSDVPFHHLTGVREAGVLMTNRPAQGSISAYRWIERDQQGPEDADKLLLTRQLPRRRDLRRFDV